MNTNFDPDPNNNEQKHNETIICGSEATYTYAHGSKFLRQPSQIFHILFNVPKYPSQKCIIILNVKIIF